MEAMKATTKSLLVLALALYASPAHADPASFAERIAVRGEVGAGTMLTGRQFAALKYDTLNVEGTLRVSLSLVDSLSVDVSTGYWFFPSPRGWGYVAPLGGGLRFEPSVGDAGRFFVDLHATASLTGDLVRLGLDGGVGFEFDLSRHLAMGPFVRVGAVLQPDDLDDDGTDAYFWAGGLSLTVRPFASASSETPDTTGTADAVPPGGDADPGAASEGDVRTGGGAPTTTSLTDPDRDGFVGPADACPDAPETFNDVNDDDGCPDTRPDTDEDGLIDAEDRCPDRPETYNGIDDDDGCPERSPALARLEGGSINLVEQIGFSPNTPDIAGETSARILDALAALLRNHPELRHIEIQGHTDDVGDEQENLVLSRRRADAVFQALVARGVDPARLETSGYGESQPLVLGTSRQARAANRRIDFLVIPELVWREQHGGAR